MRKSTYLILIAIIGSLLIITTGVSGQEIEDFDIDISNFIDTSNIDNRYDVLDDKRQYTVRRRNYIAVR